MKFPRSFLLCLLCSASLHSAEIPTPPKSDPWAEWVEPDLPFFSSVNSSALSQVRLFDAQMGPLNDILPHIGPKWHHLFGTPRTFITPDHQKATTTADEAYLREFILEPHAKTLLDFNRPEYAMPSYVGTLTESQLQALILYIISLR